MYSLPKLVEEKRERLWPVIVPELVQCRRQLAAWAAVAAWIVPTVPKSLYNHRCLAVSQSGFCAAACPQ
jgi:hypothetical protein